VARIINLLLSSPSPIPLDADHRLIVFQLTLRQIYPAGVFVHGPKPADPPVVPVVLGLEEREHGLAGELLEVEVDRLFQEDHEGEDREDDNGERQERDADVRQRGNSKVRDLLDVKDKNPGHRTAAEGI